MQALRLSIKSLLNRRFTTSMTLLSVALSVALFLGVERVRVAARESFSNTISQTHLIVGAKGGTLQLLLYSVFRMGAPTNNITYESYQKWATNPAVVWTIPISLGDSHRGFRVVGTDENFYEHYRYRRDRGVSFRAGERAQKVFDLVLGSEVAEKLNYSIGDKIVLSHGVSDSGVLLQNHDDKPFTVVGILNHTATPIDRSLYVTLEGIEALHLDWKDGAPPLKDAAISASEVEKRRIKIGQVTAFFLRTTTGIETLGLQRAINDDRDEPLMAIIPGVALSELWDSISYAEVGLKFVSFVVVLVGLFGILITIYNSLNERRREMAILRSIGAGPVTIFTMLMFESVALVFLGSIAGMLLMYVVLFLTQPFIEANFGLSLPVAGITITEVFYLVMVWGLGGFIGAVPAWRAYRHTLVDGLTIRV